MLISGKIPDIMDRHLNFIVLEGPADNPLLQRGSGRIWENRKDTYAHGEAAPTLIVQ